MGRGLLIVTCCIYLMQIRSNTDNALNIKTGTELHLLVGNSLYHSSSKERTPPNMQKKQVQGRLVGQEGEIDLLVLFKVLWQKMWLIILVAVFCCTSACVLTRLFITPTYESGFTAFINNKSDPTSQTSVTNADTSASESLANTYAEILKSRPMLEATSKLTGIKKTYSELSGMVTTKIQANTQLVDVKVASDSPEEAFYLAKTISEIAPGYLSDIVEGSSMKVVAKPVLNSNPVSPNIVKNGMLGAVLGAFLAAIIILLVELTDTRIKSPSELEETYGYSVMGTIPTVEAFSRD